MNLLFSQEAHVAKFEVQKKSAASSVKPASLTPAQFLVRGLAIGFVATQALDVISAFLYENQKPEDRLAEDEAREGRQAYERAIEKAAELTGLSLSEEQIKFWGWKFHRSFGLMGGVQYLALRQKFPEIGRGLGLGFGAAFFLIADEFLIYAAGLVPGPTKFSWKAHARGAVAHIAYGVAAELTARSFDKIAPYEAGTGFALEEDRARLPSLRGAQMSEAYS